MSAVTIPSGMVSILLISILSIMGSFLRPAVARPG
jgi:hypothetical protein